MPSVSSFWKPRVSFEFLKEQDSPLHLFMLRKRLIPGSDSSSHQNSILPFFGCCCCLFESCVKKPKAQKPKTQRCVDLLYFGKANIQNLFIFQLEEFSDVFQQFCICCYDTCYHVNALCVFRAYFKVILKQTGYNPLFWKNSYSNSVMGKERLGCK